MTVVARRVEKGRLEIRIAAAVGKEKTSVNKAFILISDIEMSNQKEQQGRNDDTNDRALTLSDVAAR